MLVDYDDQQRHSTAAAVTAASAAAACTAAAAAAAAGGRAPEPALKKQRRGFLGHSHQPCEVPPLEPDIDEDNRADAIERFRREALREIAAYQRHPMLPFFEDAGKPSDALKWWRAEAPKYPNLARLARRVLCVPATSAPSERLFSVAGLTVSKNRSRLSDNAVTLLVFLRSAWKAVESHDGASCSPSRCSLKA